MWSKVFKTGPNKNCGRQPLKKLKRYGLLHTSYGLYPLLKSETATTEAATGDVL